MNRRKLRKLRKLSTSSCDTLSSIEIQPFSNQLKFIIEEALFDTQKDSRSRRGTLFTPIFTVFVVLGSVMRHDLSYPKVVNWIICAIRWLSLSLPKKIISEGAVTKARQYLGVEVFRLIFEKFIKKHYKLIADFHGRSTVIFDGVTATVPDTQSNREAFGKPSNKKGSAAFPQIRAVALMSLTLRCIIGIAYGPIKGKGTGERALMRQLLNDWVEQSLLFLFDAGFYSFELLELFKDTRQEFLMKLESRVNVKKIKCLPSGDYIGTVKRKFANPNSTPKKRLPQIEIELSVRVIPYQLKGFRVARLITNNFDETISPIEFFKHYHKRWDIELAFDEVKNRQCATLKGQLATVFRSKTAELVEQELYAILITYNCIRQLIYQSTEIHDKEPRFISFLDVLHCLKDAIPIISAELKPINAIIDYLSYLIAHSDIDRPRRPRVNPRVVKVSISKFKRKNTSHKGEHVNFENDLRIVQTT